MRAKLVNESLDTNPRFNEGDEIEVNPHSTADHGEWDMRDLINRFGRYGIVVSARPGGVLADMQTDSTYSKSTGMPYHFWYNEDLL